jgi:hypothetical protein
MTRTEAKKQSLLEFIRWKMRNGGDSNISATMTKLRKMSYKALERWAMANDIIDNYND